MAPNKTNLSMLTELAKFAQAVADKPYAELPKLAAEGGWFWHARQVSVEYRQMTDSVRDQNGYPIDNRVNEGSAIAVSFELMLAKGDMPLDVVDTITVQVPGGTPNVSLAARAMLGPAILYTVFGRLPPPPTPQQMADAPRPRGPAPVDVDMSGAAEDRPLPGERELAAAEPNLPEVLKGQTPDGVPLFVDPYDLQADSGDVIDALLDEIKDWLPKAASSEQLLALFTKNEEAMTFIKDLGDIRDQKELKAMLDARKDELDAAPSVVAAGTDKPRRRVRA